MTFLLLVAALIVVFVCDLNVLAQNVCIAFIVLDVYELIRKIPTIILKNKILRNFNNIKQDFGLYLKLVDFHYNNVPIESMPDEIFDNSPVVQGDNVYKIANRLSYLSRLIATDEFEKAREVLKEDGFKNIAESYQLTYQANFILLELLTTRKSEVLNSLWTPRLKSFILNTTVFSPTYLTVNYTFELLANRNTDVAQQWQKTFETTKDKYILLGEVESTQLMFAKIRDIYIEETGEEMAEYDIDPIHIIYKTANRKRLLFNHTIIGIAIAALIYSRL